MRIPPHFTPDDVALYQKQNKLTHQYIADNNEELEDEFGNYSLMDLPTGRVLLMPAGEPDPNGWFVCYLSDPTANARLLVDDYVPELEDTHDTEEIPIESQAIVDGDNSHRQ